MTREARLSRMLEMHRHLKDSARIPRLHDNWDGEGSRGYALATWWRAYKLVINWCAQAIERELDIGLPQVEPADNGSIDIQWRSGTRNLLLNLAAPGGVDSFYGEHRDGEPCDLEGWISGRGVDIYKTRLVDWVARGAAKAR